MAANSHYTHIVLYMNYAICYMLYAICYHTTQKPYTLWALYIITL